MNSPTRFSEALEVAANAVLCNSDGSQLLIVRDLQGRIRIAVDSLRSEFPAEALAALDQRLAELGAFGGPGQATTPNLLFKDELFDAASLFSDPGIVDYQARNGAGAVRLLDRLLVGEDWLRPPAPTPTPENPPRLVFYGIKGGVGRSTALAVAAYALARSGKRILVLDFDLESPGVSSLLLPPERLPKFGIVDWFVEDAVGQGDSVLDQMVITSPLSDVAGADIRVASAVGLDEADYLSKLARAYADASRHGERESFGRRIGRLLRLLEQRERPDVVLIDSRAGLHDLAAISVVGLASYALLFATDSSQTWQGYHLLFSHWKQYPQVLHGIRERLILVQALFPELDQARRSEQFQERAYSLFYSDIYEPIPPRAEGADASDEAEIFSFDLKDESAPHHALRIKWNARFQEFDPVRHPDLLGEDDIDAAYGDFLRGIQRLIEVFGQ